MNARTFQMAKPTDAAPQRALLLIGIANLGIAQAFYLSLLLILPSQARQIGGDGHKALVLAIVATVGATVAMIAGISGGSISDHLCRSAGSRRPVLIAGAIIAGIALAALPTARTMATLMLAWCGAQIGLSGVLTVITTALLDWFTAAYRGMASACAAIGQVGGVLIAAAVAFTVGGHILAVGAITGTLLVVTTLPAARGPSKTDRPTVKSSTEVAPSVREGYRDVRLAWAVRAVVTFSNTLLITFVSYYVADALRMRNPQQFIGIAAGITAILVLVGALYSGRASDRSGRRRRYVVGAVLLMCLGEILLAFTRSIEGTIVACAWAGFGYGVYLAVDQALTADVLPDRRSFGRDIGLMNTSTSAPQIAAPAIAALVLSTTSSYTVLFSVGALLTLTGAAFVLPIKKVR